MNDKLTDKKEEMIAQKDVLNDGFDKNAMDAESKERSNSELIFGIKDQQMSQGEPTKAIDVSTRRRPARQDEGCAHRFDPLPSKRYCNDASTEGHSDTDGHGG